MEKEKSQGKDLQMAAKVSQDEALKTSISALVLCTGLFLNREITG